MKIMLEKEIIITRSLKVLSSCNSYLHSCRVSARGLFWHDRVTTHRTAMEACMESMLPLNGGTDPTVPLSDQFFD